MSKAFINFENYLTLFVLFVFKISSDTLIETSQCDGLKIKEKVKENLN